MHFGGGSVNGSQSMVFNEIYSNTSSMSYSNPTYDNQSSDYTNSSSFAKPIGTKGICTGNVFIGGNFHPNKAKFIVSGQFEGSMNNINLNVSGKVYEQLTQENTSITDSSANINNSSGSSNYNITEYISLQTMLTFLARAGFLIKPNILLYGLAGPVKGNLVFNDLSDNIFSKWVLGYTAGGGVEYKFNRNWSVTAEYRYLNFASKLNYSLNESNPSAGTASSTYTGIGTTSQTDNIYLQENIRTNLNYNLGSIGIIYRW